MYYIVWEQNGMKYFLENITWKMSFNTSIQGIGWSK
jgi:hypothetical protein